MSRLVKQGTHDFKDGVPVSDFEKELWVQKVLEQIAKNGHKGVVRSGNTVVFGYEYGDHIDVIIAENYKIIHYKQKENE